MSYINQPSSNSRPEGQEVDKTFMRAIHEAAEGIGSKQGRKYITILEGKLGLTPLKSKEVDSFERLITLVSKQMSELKELTGQEIATITNDLSKIQAEYKRPNQAGLYFDVLYSNVLLELSKSLSPKELAAFQLINKNVYQGINREDYAWKVKMKEMSTFGPEKWNSYFGDVGEVPALPEDIKGILKAPCPFFPDKCVFETHMLVLIPKTVNGKPLTLNSLRELVKHPTGEGKATDYEYISNSVSADLGDKPIEASYWALMTKEVLPESRNKSYSDQQNLATAKQGYEVPNLLPAAVCILMEYVSTGRTLYGREPWTYTRCQEKVQGDQTIVGGFAPAGLNVHNVNYGGGNVGVAALRKFF